MATEKLAPDATTAEPTTPLSEIETSKDAGATPNETDTDGSAAQTAAASAKIKGQRTRSKFKPDFRFWMVMTALCITSLLASLENTIIATSLPFILTELDVGSNYVWIGNAFFLTR